MKILLLGANGQVGWELQRALSMLGTLSIHDRHSADFENLNALKNLVEQEKPNVIVNAVAYTAVDQAETDQELAYTVNYHAVATLAESAKQHDACLIHYSTDYVFDGNKQDSYGEDDLTNPQSIYGKSKRDGELAIIESGCKYFIFRTSWVYASRGNNFAKTMLKLATDRDELKVVADQIGAPTSAELIADVTALTIYNLQANYQSPSFPHTRESRTMSEPSGVERPSFPHTRESRTMSESSEAERPSFPHTRESRTMSEPSGAERPSFPHTRESRTMSEPSGAECPSFPRMRESSAPSQISDDISGIYNLTASGETSWYDFAKHVITHAEKLGMQFKIKSQDITPIKTEQFPRPAKRPHNSKLNTQKLQTLLNIDLPMWQFHVDRMVKEFIENQL